MDYSSNIPKSIIIELLTMLENKMEGYPIVSKLFMIQYTYFELVNDKWVMKTFLDVGNETVKNIYLKISSRNTTNIAVYSKNPKFGFLLIKDLLDMRNMSVPGKIYACDLYEDFEPEHYEGKCYTS